MEHHTNISADLLSRNGSVSAIIIGWILKCVGRKPETWNHLQKKHFLLSHVVYKKNDAEWSSPFWGSIFNESWQTSGERIFKTESVSVLTFRKEMKEKNAFPHISLYVFLERNIKLGKSLSPISIIQAYRWHHRDKSQESHSSELYQDETRFPIPR